MHDHASASPCLVKVSSHRARHGAVIHDSRCCAGKSWVAVPSTAMTRSRHMYQNFDTRVSFAVMNSSSAGLPALVCSMPRWIAALMSPGWVTRSP